MKTSIIIIAIFLGIFAVGCSDEYLFLNDVSSNFSINITGNATGFVCANITTNSSYFYLCNVTANITGGNVTADFTNITGVKVLTFNVTSCTDASTLPEGSLCWNPTLKTMNMVTGLGNIIQIAQERFNVIKNKAGKIVYNGQIFSMQGSTGTRLEGILANSSTHGQIHNLGIVTIPSCNNNADCVVTTYGEVHDLDTSMYLEGEDLYLTTDGSGNFTNIKTHYPNYSIHIGTVIRSHATDGIIMFDPEIDITDGVVLNSLGVINNVTASTYFGNSSHLLYQDNLTLEPTGFPEQSTFSSTLAFNNVTRNFTISGIYDILWRGILIHKNGVDSIIIPNNSGYTSYIYYDSTGTLQTSLTPWNNDFFNVIQVATVFYNGSIGLIGKERHGITMDSSTHYWMHTTVGTRYISGFTGTFTNGANWSLTSGAIADEDNIDSNSAQNVTRIFYHVSTGRYTFSDVTNFLYYNKSNIIQYDILTGTADVQNNYYVAYWLVESVDRDNPTYTIMGQREDVTLNNAQLNNKWETMNLGALDIPEYKLLYRVILRRSGTSATIVDIQDLRSVSNLPAGTYIATSHSTLTGLTNDDHLQYVLADGTRNMTYLDVTNNITAYSLYFGQKTGIYDLIRVNPYGSDGFTLAYWYDFELANDDWLVLQKTDGNDDFPDGGIAFMMSNTTNNRTILKLDGYGLANFTDYNIKTTGNITAGNICYSNGTNCPTASQPTLTNITGSGVPFIINATNSTRCIRFEATSVFIGSGSSCYG